MEIKKTPKADLKNKRGLLLEIGFIFALGVLIVAFNYTPKEHRIQQIETIAAVVEEEIIEITRQDLKPPAPPKKVEIKVLSQLLKVVDNETVVETEVDFTEFDEEIEVLQSIDGVEDAVEDDTPFLVAEHMPSFQGGDLSKFHRWVQSNVVYPQMAQSNGISGRVTLTFVIEKDGSLTNIQVLQTPDRLLSDEAIRVLNMSPKWNPGKQRNQPVRVRFTLPVVFNLN